jgi:hypothetical protein
MVRVTVLKPIKRPLFDDPFWPRTSIINYDARRPRAKKLHQLLHQQGEVFGMVGDRSDSLTHAEMLQLWRDGFLRIEGRFSKAAS